MSFDISSIFDGAQAGHNGRMQIEYIRFDKVVPDERNFYSMDEKRIEDLAGSIAAVGLQQPIVVRPSGADGEYTITSGHRRRAAWELLWKDSPTEYAEIPCIVQDADELPEMTELRLLLANSDTRKMSDADLATQADRIYECLYRLKEQGVEFPGRMRDRVAEAVGVSKSKLSRLKIIKDGLQGDYLAEWQAGKLPESTAIALAKLEPALQDEIFALSRKTNGNTAYGLDLYLSRRGKTPDHCNGLRGECQHIGVMREKMWKASSWEVTCSGCCIECGMLESCRESCTWCQAVIGKKDALKAETKAKRTEERQKEKLRAIPIAEYLSGVLGRIYSRMQEQGLSVPDLLKCGTRSNDFGAGDALLLLMGSKKPQDGTRIPISWGYGYSDCQGLIDAAKKLECSIDWLLTGNELEQIVPKMGAGWQTAQPLEVGDYICIYQWDNARSSSLAKMRWDSGRWIFGGSKLDDLGCTVQYWISAPKEAEL